MNNEEEFDKQLKEFYNNMTDEERENMFKLFSKAMPSFKIVDLCDKFGNTMQTFIQKTRYIQDEELIKKACSIITQFDSVLTDFNNEYLGGIKIDD